MDSQWTKKDQWVLIDWQNLALKDTCNWKAVDKVGWPKLRVISGPEAVMSEDKKQFLCAQKHNWPGDIVQGIRNTISGQIAEV